MSAEKHLESLIKENKAFLRKYEDAYAANANDFGAKLMVGNLKLHLESLELQLKDLQASKIREHRPSASAIAAASSH